MEEDIFEKTDADCEERFLTSFHDCAFTVTPIEDSVIKKATEGDKAAFEAIFMGTYRYVFAVARAYLRRDEDIYDAIQDTYLRVYKGLPRLEAVTSFYPWLHRIAENCAKDQLKFNGKDTVTIDGDEVVETLDQDGSRDVSADVSEVLKQLPKEQAELLIRVYYDKMRVAEIARMQSVPVTTVHNRLKAAKKKLRELLLIRGIDKPIYGGEFISVIATAIRNSIGTELLSLAVAEEILHNVTKSADKRRAFVVATFARKMRNQAAKRIANSLMLVSVLLTAAALFTVTLFIKKPVEGASTASLVGGIGTENNSSAEDFSDIPSSPLSESGTVDSFISEDAVFSDNDASSTLSSEYDFFPMIPETNVLMTGSLLDEGKFGTFSENGKLPIATTKDRIYAVSSGSLVSVQKGSSDAATLHCDFFGSLYTEKSSFLNVYDGRAYWIDSEDGSRFILNRANLDGSEHYSVTFEEVDCTYLTKLLVTEEGVYFTAGVHGDFNHRESGTLYRADLDFNITDRVSGIADYAIVGDKLYYIKGMGNYGFIYYADRYTLEESGSVSSDYLKYGTLYAFGDYLVANMQNPYGHSEGGFDSGYRIIDTRTNETVRRVDGEGAKIEILDASGYDGGTLVYRWGNEVLSLNIQSGRITEDNSPLGTVLGDYKYCIRSDGQALIMYDIRNNKKYSLH